MSANITGTLFHIQDRNAGIAIGYEHRIYDGIFDPDPLRQTGESQDSQAFAVQELRVVMIFDVWRPELSEKEPILVGAMLGAADQFDRLPPRV